MELKKVVVTGLGAITPIGNNIAEFWEGLKSGKSGAGPITRMDVSRYKTRIACEVKNFDAGSILDPKDIRSMDLYTQYAIAAAAQAVSDSHLEKVYDPFRVGVIFSTGIGGLTSLQEEIVQYAKNEGRPRFSPHMITKMIPNMAAGIIGMRFDFRGPNYAIVTACASSSHAIIDAMNLIRLGKVDAIIAGGSEAPINATSVGGFSSMRALSERNDEPQTASRPFDASRDGFVIGEGAGALVLESYDAARARGAHIYAEIAGGGISADAYHFTLPHPEGRSVSYAITEALREAGATSEDVDYINLHGTSTPAGDPPELVAVANIFRNSLDRLHASSTKSMTGHLLGAAGAVEAIATILAINNETVPPTINTEKIDPAIDANVDITLRSSVPKQIRVALSNTFGFGGQNACVAIRRVE